MMEAVGEAEEDSFFRLIPTGENKYRRGLILSRINTPCCPYPCKFVLPESPGKNAIGEIQQHLFLSLPYSTVLSCIDLFRSSENLENLDGKYRKFADYGDAVIFMTSRNVLSDEVAKVDDGSYIYISGGGRHVLSAGSTSEIVNLVKPHLATIPYRELKLVEMDKLTDRKIRNTRNLYKKFGDGLSKRPARTELASAYHRHLYDTIEVAGSSKALEIGGLGYGEHIYLRRRYLKELIENSPTEKMLRILPLQTGTILEIFQAVLLGIDVVVTPYHLLLADKGIALTFDIPEYKKPERFSMRDAIALSEAHCKCEEGNYRDELSYTIDLKDPNNSLAVDEKIHKNSIRAESRAYIHHLLVCKEIMGHSAIISHNIGMMELLFREIRKSMEEGCLYTFVCRFISKHKLSLADRLHRNLLRQKE